MSTDPTDVRTSLDGVEQGLDEIERALARLDAGAGDDVAGGEVPPEGPEAPDPTGPTRPTGTDDTSPTPPEGGEAPGS